MTVKHSRPVTRALQLVNAAPVSAVSDETFLLSLSARNELRTILRTIDASTGKPDSARKKRPTKKARR